MSKIQLILRNISKNISKVPLDSSTSGLKWLSSFKLSKIKGIAINVYWYKLVNWPVLVSSKLKTYLKKFTLSFFVIYRVIIGLLILFYGYL